MEENKISLATLSIGKDLVVVHSGLKVQKLCKWLETKHIIKATLEFLVGAIIPKNSFLHSFFMFSS